MTRKGASIKDTIGIYVLFNEDNVYYIGISFKQPFRKRVGNHLKRCLGTFKDKPVKAFDDFCKLLKENNQCSENGRFYANCKVLWFPILNDDLTKGELEFLESKCVHELEPILNNEIYNVFGLDNIKL